MSELGKVIAFGEEAKRGNLIPCEAGHPMYVVLQEIMPDDVGTWGHRLVRCDGGEQPTVGGSEGVWALCHQCRALLARTAGHGGGRGVIARP